MNNFQLKLSTQAYSQREAWNFLKDNGSCLTVSIRQLATLWKWHRSKVERFIKFLKTGAFIETEIVSGRTMIKVNNYNSITPIISVFLNHNETISEDEFEINKRKKSPNSNKLGEDQDVYDGKFDVTRNEEDNQDNELEFKTISRQNKDSLASAITLKEEKKKRSKKRKEEIKETPPPPKGG
jgi:Zn-dependent oligopeptidase